MPALAYLPSPSQGVWHLGPVPLRAYALAIITGVVLAVVIGERRWVARGGTKGVVTDVATVAVPFGIVGARAYHVVTSPAAYLDDPVSALYVWQGGLGIPGGIAGGFLAGWVVAKRRGIARGAFADAIAPGVAVAQAVGRLGNWFNQELFGRPTTLPWGLEIDADNPDAVPGAEAYHPTFLYELLWNLGVAGVVVWADRRFRLGHGRAFALYIAGYTAGRFWIEQMRTDHATRVFGDIRINVVLSVVVFAAAVLYIALVRKPREVLETPGEASPTEPAPADETTGGTDRPAEEKDGAEAGSARPHSGDRAP